MGYSGTGSHFASVCSTTVTRSATPAESDVSSLKKAILLQLGISPGDGLGVSSLDTECVM